MAQFSIGEGRWRMIRAAVERKRFQFIDVRSGGRQDRERFQQMIDKGWIVAAADQTTPIDRSAWPGGAPEGNYTKGPADGYFVVSPLGATIAQSGYEEASLPPPSQTAKRPAPATPAPAGAAKSAGKPKPKLKRVAAR